jgi:hypothetical protein
MCKHLRERLGPHQIDFTVTNNVLRHDRWPGSTAIVEVRHQEVSCEVFDLYCAR